MENVDASITAIQNISEINKSVNQLKETDGWPKLSSIQQKMIKTSLLISNRAFRETDPASADAIGTEFGKDLRPMIYEEHELKSQFRLNPKNHNLFLRGYKHKPENRKYRESQNTIAKLNCHRAVRSLEVNNFSNLDPEKEDLSYFETNDTTIANSMEGSETGNEIGEKIKEVGYPCVFISYKDNLVKQPEHSFLVLGPNKKGEIICWDKVDWGRPFRVTTLSKLLEENYYQPHKYSKYTFGVRKLRQL